MSDYVKILGEMSLDNLFVIAGLAFLAVGVIGKFSGKMDPSPAARVISALVGFGLICSGLIIHHGHRNAGPLQQPTTPIKAVHAQESQPLKNPAETHSGGGSTKPVGLAFFNGTWKNVDAQTRGVTTLKVRTSGASVWVRAWGKCHPTDCDWGEVSGTAFAPGVSSDPVAGAQTVTAVFPTSFSDTVMNLTPAGSDSLDAETETRFTDDSGRSPYSATYTFRH